MPTLVSRCVTFRLPPLPRDEIIKALAARKGLEGAAASLLAALSGGALGKAMDRDPELAMSLRRDIEGVFSAPRGPARLDRGLRLAAAMASGYSSAKGSEEDTDASARAAAAWLETAELSLRLWWRDAAVLGASGDEGLLEVPPPSGALRGFAGELAPDALPAFEAACHRMTDSLGRFVRPDMVFVNFWAAVLE
jgi:hypothetical protein